MDNRKAAVITYVMNLDPLLRRVTILIVTMVVVTMVTGRFQGNDSTDGGSGSGNGYRIVSLAGQQPVATGNCPDAQFVATTIGPLVGLAGQAATSVRLYPTTGCGASVPDLLRYRARVDAADLTLEVTGSNWTATPVESRRSAPAALARMLRAQYPHARVLVTILVSGRRVGHVDARPVAGVVTTRT